MKKFSKFLCAAVVLLVLLCSACRKPVSVTEIPLGDKLPVWTLQEAHTAEALPKQAKEQGLVGVYTTDTDKTDVYVYQYPNADSLSLEAFGQAQADAHHIFCNMLTDRDVPVAVLNYYGCPEDEHAIVQAYIYETEAGFVEVRTLFKTEEIPLGDDDLSIRMIREYNAKVQADSPLRFDTVYETENKRLPLLRIKRAEKADFRGELVDSALRSAVSDAQYAALAEDGWTIEEIISLYDEGYDLLKGEVVRRNDLDLAFIGYIDNGIFKTRAFIEDEDTYVLLCAEAEASKFQHVTNALIDAIEQN